ncbi:MAG: TonB-dependent receptor, partial [Chitinophagaceae bacterium]
MTRILAIIYSLFFLTNTVLSQDGEKIIRLVNELTGIPVANGTVHNSRFSFIRLSDQNGRVSLAGLPAGDQELIISSVGFASKTININETGLEITVRLTPKISSLQEVVVNAGSQKGVFHTISDLDIQLHPIFNSQEVLRIVPGLFIGQHAGGGKAEQIFLRGFDLDHGTDINISVDGLPVNMVSHAHGQGYADLHFVIPELIEKVNFSKGPYDAEKGNMATAGYVEFQTKNFLDKNFVKLEGGQFNTARLITGINLLNTKNNKEKTQSLYFGGEASYSDNFFETPQHFNRLNGILKYHGRVGASSYLTAFISGFSSRWGASGQIPLRSVKDGSIGWFGAIDDTEGGKTSRYNFNTELTSYFKKGLKWKNQVLYTRYLFELYSNFTFFLNDPVNGDQIRQKEARNLFGVNSVLDKEHLLGRLQTKFQSGIQVRFDATENTELSRTLDRTTVTSPIQKGNISELNAGVFAEEIIKFSSAFDLTVGIRGDYFSNSYDDKLNATKLRSGSFMASPKLNFDFRLNKNLHLYWHNGQGFHSNDTRVAVQQNGRDVLTPAWGTDLGVVFKLGDKAVLQSALWYLWLAQEFVYVGDEGVVEPGGKSRRIGWDASLRYEFVKNIFLDIDLNYANPRALEVAREESYLPLA